MTNQHPIDVHQMLHELTRPHHHAERYTQNRGPTTITKNHVTRVPSLLHQLEHAEPAGSGARTNTAGFESRPAARIEATDTLIRIDLEAAAWIRDMGEDDPPDTTACLQRLAGLLPTTHRCHRHTPTKNSHGTPTCCTWHTIEHDVHRWWTQARIVTGWETPAWRPDATCPECHHRGGLRVRLEERTALCVECRATYGPDTYMALAAHVRTETEARRRAAAPEPVDVPAVANRASRGW